MSRARTPARRLLVLGLLTALLAVALPVAPVHAITPAPETREAVIDASKGAKGAQNTADGADHEGLPSAVADDEQASEVLEAPFPFSLVGFRGTGSPQLLYRARLAEGGWSDWTEVEQLGELDGPDADSDEAVVAERVRGEATWSSDPYWVGEADALQLLVRDGALDEVDVHVIDSLGHSEPLLRRAARHLRGLTTAHPAQADFGQPAIVTREQWGADEGLVRTAARHAPPRYAVLHHTAGSNSYTREQAPGIVRAIQRWHITGNGWSDIGYNLLIDRYGTVYEGRAGGVTRGVVGAHAANHNRGSVGVSVLGNFENARPPQVVVDVATEVLAWKYRLHNIDPRATSQVLVGDRWIPRLVGHRDVGRTACPGRYLAAHLPAMRERIAQLAVQPAIGWTPVVGDWFGTGQDSIGWFRDGEWRLHHGAWQGAAVTAFGFGQPGDLPVVGDWNGDGSTTVGVVRGGRWLLRNTNTTGPADLDFWYGRGAIDHPMAGDWNGNGRDGPAIVRDGEWHLRNSLSGGAGEIVFTYGRVLRGDVPVVGDWNADGRDTPAILRDRHWHLRNEHSGGPGGIVFIFGRLTAGDIPVAGNWNGDRRSGVGVTRAGQWHLRDTLSGGPAEFSFLGW